MDALTYYVDLMGWLFGGKRLAEVYARGQMGVLKPAGHEANDVSYAIFTYDDGTVVNLGVSYALPEKYPALGHAARVEVLGTEGVMILDDDHTDQLMYTEKGIPHVYLPDQAVNMVFLQSGTPGDWALGEFWGPIANETRAWLDHLCMGRPCVLATAREARATLEGDARDRAFVGERQAGEVAAGRMNSTPEKPHRQGRGEREGREKLSAVRRFCSFTRQGGFGCRS